MAQVPVLINMDTFIIQPLVDQKANDIVVEYEYEL